MNNRLPDVYRDLDRGNQSYRSTSAVDETNMLIRMSLDSWFYRFCCLDLLRFASLSTLWIQKVLLVLIVSLCACTPTVYPRGVSVNSPHLTETEFVTDDGSRLPYRYWRAEDVQLNAVIVAVHGFNDYSNFFTDPGNYLSNLGIASYAYDQRGFGGAPNKGIWSGVETYTHDLIQFTNLIKQRNPEVPVYLLGESMGASIIITALTKDNPPEADGIILSAPAVWSRTTMPWYQRTLLWTAAHTVPWLTVSGNGLGVKPSDNIEMRRALARDPMVIKETRIGTIYGLANLMDNALEQSSRIDAMMLILYGKKDEIIPKQAAYLMLKSLPKMTSNKRKIAIYKNGYHMLLRDLQAEILWNDIAAWIKEPDASLPSKADSRAFTA